MLCAFFWILPQSAHRILWRKIWRWDAVGKKYPSKIRILFKTATPRDVMDAFTNVTDAKRYWPEVWFVFCSCLHTTYYANYISIQLIDAYCLKIIFWRFFVNFISKLSSGQYWPFSIPWNHVCIYRHNYIWRSTWINGYVILHRTIQEVVIRKLSWECKEVYAASGSLRGEWKEKWVRLTYAKSTPQGRHTRAQPCPVYMIRLSCMNSAARWKRFRNMGRCTYHMKMKFYMETPSLFLY